MLNRDDIQDWFSVVKLVYNLESNRPQTILPKQDNECNTYNMYNTYNTYNTYNNHFQDTSAQSKDLDPVSV